MMELGGGEKSSSPLPIVSIGFGIEEILREQRESDRRIRRNLEEIKRRR